ncbi:MAG: GIY-YIG nuclease family protein [Gammaproteobacteria bacterium]|nr:GIY-YIG nuclease family protein [Gammaproteobacteria bacterium]MCW8922335.1 GIY-YIG nuclease family protein [Gammaproteobacteria bacterium]
MSKTGTYIVVLKSECAKTIGIGRLGPFRIKRGYYVYVGSAMGPGGVASRLKHHCKISNRPHWHLDYLRAETRFYAAYALHSADRRECDWAMLLSKSELADAPMQGFGSSDCRCDTHLFYFSSARDVVTAIQTLNGVQKIEGLF